MRPSLRWTLIAAVIGVLVAGIVVLTSDGAGRARIRLVQATTDPAIAADRTLGDLLGTHAHLPAARWEAGWGGDERLVSAVVALPRLDALDAGLLAPLRAAVARTPEWSGTADDRPAVLRIVFRVDQTAEQAVLPVKVVAEQAWVVYRPELTDAHDQALDAANATSEQRSAAQRYRLVHDGARALFDAGLHEPLLAGPGLAPTASQWLAQLARWH